jgi:predicted ATP-grasp superfamily ATP-dependent carboligase
MAEGREGVEIVSAGGAMVIEIGPAFEPPVVSVARAENENVPALEGVPEIVPELVSEKPSGSAPETIDQV